MSVQEALHWFCEGCLSSWSLLGKQQQYAHITELRRLLTEPLTADEAEALRHIGDGQQSMEEVIDWLRHAPLSRAEHRKLFVRRILAGLGPVPGYPTQGYLFDFRGRDSFLHQFCGEHSIPGADCPNCRKPLLRLLSLDTRDSRLMLGRQPFPFLHLFYCWTCEIAFDFFVYRIGKSGEIEKLYFGRGPGRGDWPYPDYPVAFPPRKVHLKPLSRRHQDMLRVFNAAAMLAPVGDEDELIDPRHQVGGEPHSILPFSRMLCQICSQPMPLLATICDNAGGPCAHAGYADHLSFTHNAEIQVMFHFCRPCGVVGAYHTQGWEDMVPGVRASAADSIS